MGQAGVSKSVAGFTFGVIGAFYGLLLAFVIVAAWERFDRAPAEVHDEAASLMSLYRLSKGFPRPVATEMQGAIRTYTHKLIDKDWPEMANYVRKSGFDHSDSVRRLCNSFAGNPIFGKHRMTAFLAWPGGAVKP